MKCVRCSAEIPAQSQFCLRCGVPVHATLPPTGSGHTAAYLAPRRSSRALVVASVILAVALLGLSVYLLPRLTQKPANDAGGQLVQAPGQGSAGSLVQAPASPRPSAPVQAPADALPDKSLQKAAPTVNTAEIDDYLRFVKDVEDRKMRLTKSELADALASQASQLGRQAAAATDDEKSKEYLPSVGRDSAQFDQQWNDLTKYFATRVPPPSCVELHDKYYNHLGKIQGMFVKVHSALAEAQSDPSKALQSLTAMQGTASQEADSSARLADDALYDVCKQYNLRKEFDIKTDPSASSSMLR